MQEPHAVEQPDATTADHSDDMPPDFEPPPGNHALEIAARRGLGPLSPMGKKVWHGGATPCVSCGQLVHREDDHCDHCGQDLSEEMIEKMRVHSGPWYVLEHVRPFPGVSLERIIRQIHRGLLTETSIVRGPSTDFQWRFAVETPGLCRYFGRCWNCHEPIQPADTYCQTCLQHLSFEKPRPKALAPGPKHVSGAPGTRPGQASPAARAKGRSAGPPTDDPLGLSQGDEQAAGAAESLGELASSAVSVEPMSAELQRLTAALRKAEIAGGVGNTDAPPRVAGLRVGWIAGALIVLVVAALLWIASQRGGSVPPPTPAPAPSSAAAPVVRPAPVESPPPSPQPPPPETSRSPQTPPTDTPVEPQP